MASDDATGTNPRSISYSEGLILVQMLSGLGRLVANKILKFLRGTNRSSYTQLCVTFFLSAALHSTGGFVGERWMASRCFKFFLLQAAAITLYRLSRETFIAPMGNKTQPGEWWRVLGGNGCKGHRLLLSDFMVLFDGAGVYRRSQCHWIL